MRYFKIILVCFLGLISNICFADNGESIDYYQKPMYRIQDYTHSIRGQELSYINSQLKNIYDTEKGTEIEVVLIPTLPQNTTIEMFSLTAFNKWKLGTKDLNNGVLIVIVKDTSSIRIQTGSGIDGALPDSYLGRVMDDNHIKQQLQSGIYYKPINQMIESINTQISKEYKGATYSGLSIEQWVLIFIVICLIFFVGVAKTFGDTFLTFLIIRALFELLIVIINVGISAIGGGGGSSGGGSSR